MHRFLITTFLLAFTFQSFGQTNVIPATKSELTGIELPVGSKQDKRILSTATAKTLLQMKADENAIILGDKMEVFNLPVSATKQSEVDVKLAVTGLTNTKIISDNLSDRINEIKQQAGKDILLFGSPTATHSLIQLNLIDGYWLFVNPIILGRGIPLFVDIKDKIKLSLLTTPDNLITR